ncbi:aliphatic sulfonate ABC transporter substrate-binding protein [Desertifilum sp. FACHB-1129]|uniref:Putative aliphatic sulfonates-binding protein n=1 Tax=Desertifilum tharense IPPAS B-1220 TaxID=1781255 RepID=A0A1E5QNJ9_9CYAN|nr:MULTISPECIES: aliphatic sulfonate ABC transporter substrate-binding protein [Desertifilum]MDA0212211.1 aliphatic sulfonate ABC transporter substrate-binding protein [Cyanobacteria bacterium FC1]MBD2312790.1 aliphatic sulfonate ABC transporter substrate-binding protein [Desertifilum sp. FACHB-1129]MBD2324154.1 aliphatic sulfonate ABC transporter substrate-binding protein [Desertifilum sp. FACHB-866]MBD2334168.1 aliphatic sulfonate ABC transporter substrate-binding protein [Desertifilum sp. FA
MHLKRRDVLFGLLGFSLPVISSSCANRSEAPNLSSTTSPTPQPGLSAVRIGYQRFSELDLIRTRGELDRQLQQQGVKVEWSFFQSGPPMLEAMNTGSLDIAGVGEAPPIFAQAAGTQFFYIASTPRGLKTQDIVVPKTSSIQSPEDLRGKKVALQRGSSAHYLFVQVLRDRNIPIEEVEIVPLSPADARAAFEQGTVDAWSIWDPFLGVIEATGNVRNLNLGRDRRAFFLASQNFVNTYPDRVKAFLLEAKLTEEWGQQNARAIAQQFSEELKIDVAILEKANQRRGWGLLPITPEAIAAQQRVADTFYELAIIPKSIQVAEVTVPEQIYAQLYPST